MNALPVVPSNRIRVNPDAPTFADLTTLGVGGTISNYIEATTEAELIDAVRAADTAGEPLYVIGGGSNTVATDQPFHGTVVRDLRTEIRVDSDSSCGGAAVTATAGTPWDQFVAHAVQNQWMGLEGLSGIPGTVGAAPVQNVGAYGQEVAHTLASVTVWDRHENRRRLLPLADLELGYRTSIIKRSRTDASLGGGRTWGGTGRWVILEASFQLRHASLSAPIRYGQLAAALGVEIEQRVPATDVRAAVLEIRKNKGMVLDDADRDTWSAGSFFTNPIVDDAQAANLPADAPRFPVYHGALATGIGYDAPLVEGKTKISAGWLIQHSGFTPGYALEGSGAALNSRHALAIVNRGDATATQVWELAQTIMEGVESTFGVHLESEPIAVQS